MVRFAAIALAIGLSADALACKWTKVGEATFSLMFWDLYTATLYSDAGNYNGITAPLRLDLTYHRQLSAQQIYDETLKQLERLDWPSDEKASNKGSNLDGLSEWLQRYKEALPQIKSSDVLSFELLAASAAVLKLNGETIARFPASQNNRRFLAIWLSESTSRPKLRQRLIGHR